MTDPNGARPLTPAFNRMARLVPIATKSHSAYLARLRCRMWQRACLHADLMHIVQVYHFTAFWAGHETLSSSQGLLAVCWLMFLLIGAFIGPQSSC
jgi:hypothetical protein